MTITMGNFWVLLQMVLEAIAASLHDVDTKEAEQKSRNEAVRHVVTASTNSSRLDTFRQRLRSTVFRAARRNDSKWTLVMSFIPIVAFISSLWHVKVTCMQSLFFIKNFIVHRKAKSCASCKVWEKVLIVSFCERFADQDLLNIAVTDIPINVDGWWSLISEFLVKQTISPPCLRKLSFNERNAYSGWRYSNIQPEQTC